MAAWAFAAAGLGATQGVATAVVYGVVVLVASLPGAIVLLVAWLRQRLQRSQRPQHHPEPAAEPSRLLASATAGPEGAAHG